MLDMIEGVSETSIPKQGGEPMKASGAGSKGKEKIIVHDDDDDEEGDETDKLKLKARDAELDENLILNKAIDNPNIYWLEPVGSFELDNSLDLQLDLSITPKAFLFCSFDKIANVSPSNKGTNKVARGAMSSMHEFTLVDMPCVNPFNWISLLLLILKVEQNFEPIIAHLKRMLVSYIQEVGKMDVEIAIVLNKKPTVLPKEPPKDLDTMKLGRILKKDWSVAFQIREKSDANFHRVCFFLPEKHLYYTSCLEYIVEFVSQDKENNAIDRKCFSDMINWYVRL
ncbi:unnamed protein product [Lactuca saligna]|uniref:Uncharacterized protein n=1 Tax=Lactuca saligna TaxID=75948 RepID=A0AA35UQW9_LACSI|nr:unnamed protein product [Lactuca saligna]